MKRIKKYGLLIITVLGIMLLVACSKENKKDDVIVTQPTTQETETVETSEAENIEENQTVIYELNQSGITGKVTIEYDENNVAKKSTSETIINYVEASLEKAVTEETAKTQDKTYENIKGAEHKIDYTDEGLNEVLVLKYDELSEDVKNALFATVLDDNGNIMADKLGQKFEELGYIKQ